MPTDDADLGRRFDALRLEDLQRVPPFPRAWTATRQSRPPRRRIAAAVAAAAAAVVILVVARLPRASVQPPVPTAASSILEWRSPTDFLLNTPGQPLLATVPTITRPPAPESFHATPSPDAATKGATS